MTGLRDAEYIRMAERYGYPVGEGGGELDCGECPALPDWLRPEKPGGWEEKNGETHR